MAKINYGKIGLWLFLILIAAIGLYLNVVPYCCGVMNPIQIRIAEHQVKQGDANAAYSLSVHYRETDDVEQEGEDKGLKYWREAVKLGSDRAVIGWLQLMSGHRQKSNLPVSKLAFQRGLRLAESGNKEAMVLIGKHLWLGIIVPKDLDAGEQWLNRASASGETWLVSYFICNSQYLLINTKFYKRSQKECTAVYGDTEPRAPFVTEDIRHLEAQIRAKYPNFGTIGWLY